MNAILVGTAQTFSVRMATFTVNLVTVALYTRQLGPELKGFYVLASLIPTFLVGFVLPPMDLAHVHLCGREKGCFAKLASNSFVAGLFLAFLASAAITASCQISQVRQVLQSSSIDPLSFYIAMALVPLMFLFRSLSRILQGLGKIGHYNLSILVMILGLFTSVLFFYLKQRISVSTVLISEGLAQAAGIVFTILLLRRHGPLSLSFDPELFKRTLSYSLKAYAWNASLLLQKKLDLLLAAFFLSPVALGYYSCAATVLEKMGAIPDSFCTALFPTVSASKQRAAGQIGAFAARHAVFVMGLAGVTVILGADLIVAGLFGRSFEAAVPLVQILAIGAVGMCCLRILSFSYAGLGNPERGGWAAIVHVVILAVLALLFIPAWGETGLAWASALAYLGTGGMIALMFSKTEALSLRDLFIVSAREWREYRHLLVNWARDKIR